MIDDRTGKSVGHDPLKMLVAARDEKVLEAATRNFVHMATAALERYPSEYVAAYEDHLVQLFDGIVNGLGSGWVRSVFAEARETKRGFTS